MKIRPIWFLSSIIILMELGVTRLIPISMLQSAWLSYKYISVICLIIYLYFLITKPTLNRNNFYGKYASIVVLFFICETAYTFFTFGASIVEIISTGAKFFILLLPAVLIEKIDSVHFKKFIQFTITATLLMLGFRFVLWLLYTQTNKTPFVEVFYYYRYYQGIYRLDGSALCMPVLIYEWYGLLSEKSLSNKIKKFILSVFCISYVFVVNQSRALEICVILILLSMWLTVQSNIRWKLISILLGCVAIVLILNSGYMANLIESLSPENVTYGGSTLTRTNALEYYFNVKGISLFGYGFLPATGLFMTILRGADQSFYFEDLGLLGIIFSNGILGLILYLIPLCRMLKIYRIMKRRKAKSSMFVLGILVYNISCVISLSQFDMQRIVGYIFMICLTEYLFYQSTYQNNFEEVKIIEK
nr:hypothetical protein [uncultured Anaerobutyricum sp.]